MDTRHYQTVPYKLIAAASHVTDPGVWSYYAERLRRRVTRQSVHFFSRAESEAVYGSHVHELEPALQAVGLHSPISDPRVVHETLFAQGNQQIDQLDIPFRKLGIAGASDLRLIYSTAIAIGARDILETGVALGWSSLALLNVAEQTDGRLVSIDLPYPFLIGQSWVGAAVPQNMHRRWTLLRGSDRSEIPKALRMSDGYDLIHYDSDKSPQGRLWSYPRLWEALRPGGMLLSDDIGDNGIWKDFCASVGVPLIVVRRQNAFAGLARKPAAGEAAVRLSA